MSFGSWQALVNTDLDASVSLAEPLGVSQKFLRFQLSAEDTALLTVDRMAEIIMVWVNEILPVPEMPSCVLGILNWRGKMLWLVDLGHLLGFPPLFSQDRLATSAMAIVLQRENQYLGLVISQVIDIEQYESQQMHPADAQLFPPELLPFLQGFFIDTNREIIITIDVEAIFQVPWWQTHRS